MLEVGFRWGYWFFANEFLRIIQIYWGVQIYTKNAFGISN